MTTDDFRAKCRRTKEILQEGGVDIAVWARNRGFRPQVVQDLLDGRISATHGMAREVALTLGLVYPNSTPLDEEFAVDFSQPHRISASAVVSLWSVLIEKGIMQGAHENVASVVAPKDPNAKSRWRPIVVGGFVPFHFHELDQRLLEEAGHQGADSLDPEYPFPVATPERALMDWFAVRHRKGPDWVQLPPLKLKLDLMDLSRLERLAAAMGMVSQFAEWMQRRDTVMLRADRSYKRPTIQPLAAASSRAPETQAQQASMQLRAADSSETQSIQSDGSSADDWASNAWPD